MILRMSSGTLEMPVGIMCFKGLPLHYTDIVALLEHSPSTDVIIDHFGFFLQGNYCMCHCLFSSSFSLSPSLLLPLPLPLFISISLSSTSHLISIDLFYLHSISYFHFFPSFSFFLIGGIIDETAWEQLLSLAAYPQVRLKV